MTQQPLDADAVLRDDALLDALSRGEVLPEFGDDAAVKLLLAWRDDVVGTAGLAKESPAPAVPVRSIGTAKVPEPAPTPPRRDRRGLLSQRVSRRAVVAAVAATIGVGSIGSVAAASVAEPGSPLWPITKVVYEDRAKSVEARESSLSLLRRAQEAADHNDSDEAKRLLDTALKEADQVNDEDDKDKIEQQADEVRAQLAAIEDEPTAPASPPASPQAPAPTGTSSPAPAPSPTPEPSSPANPSPTTEPQPEPTPPPPTPEATPPPTPESTAGGSAPAGLAETSDIGGTPGDTQD